MQGAEQKVSEGVSALAEVQCKAGEEREQSSKALHAQQAAAQAAQQHLQAAQVADFSVVTCIPTDKLETCARFV